MPTAADAALLELAETLAAHGPKDVIDLYVESVRETWWRRDADGSVVRHSLHREAAAARRDGALYSSDGLDRLAVAALLDIPARLVPPLALPDPPPEAALDAWPGDDVSAVRWRWSSAAVIAGGRAAEVTRPILAELTTHSGARELSTWPPPPRHRTESTEEREVRPPTGRFPLLLAPSAAAVLVHEAVGHRLEADLLPAATAARPPLGERLLAAPLEVADDPTLDLPGGYTADDEGVPAGRRLLISEGRVVSLLADRRAAARHGVPPGNARRGGAHAPPRPRISNLVTGGGCRSLGSLRSRAAVEVLTVEAGTLEAAATAVWLVVGEARALRRGRPVAPVTPFTLRIDLDRLADLPMTASRRTLATARPGWCRKHGEVVATGAVTPWILIDGVEAQ